MHCVPCTLTFTWVPSSQAGLGTGTSLLTHRQGLRVMCPPQSGCLATRPDSKLHRSSTSCVMHDVSHLNLGSFKPGGRQELLCPHVHHFCKDDRFALGNDRIPDEVLPCEGVQASPMGILFTQAALVLILVAPDIPASTCSALVSVPSHTAN